MTAVEMNRARRLLCALQDSIRDTLVAAQIRQAATFAKVAAVTAADTIYHVDRLSEAAIMAWFEAHWPRAWPVELVMEGLEDGEPATFPRGTPVARTRFKCILDPIDGTRSYMYDKRSAWSLAGLAVQRGTKNHLGDIVVAAMTELPTSKQWRADQLSAVRGGGVIAEGVDVRDGGRKKSECDPRRRRILSTDLPRWRVSFPRAKVCSARWRNSCGRSSACTGKMAGNWSLTTNTFPRAGSCMN